MYNARVQIIVTVHDISSLTTCTIVLCVLSVFLHCWLFFDQLKWKIWTQTMKQKRLLSSSKQASHIILIFLVDSETASFLQLLHKVLYEIVFLVNCSAWIIYPE